MAVPQTFHSCSWDSWLPLFHSIQPPKQGPLGWRDQQATESEHGSQEQCTTAEGMLRTHSHWPLESQSWGWMFQQEKWDGKWAVLALYQLLCLPWCSVLTLHQKEHLAGSGKCGFVQSSWTKDAAFAWSQKSFHCLRVSSVQLLSCVRLWDPMDCSTPGFSVHHQLPELTQTLVHRIGDAIQPSHPLSSPSPPSNLSQHQGLFR